MKNPIGKLKITLASGMLALCMIPNIGWSTHLVANPIAGQVTASGWTRDRGRQPHVSHQAGSAAEKAMVKLSQGSRCMCCLTRADPAKAEVVVITVDSNLEVAPMKKNGFSLIELVVAMGIIGILAAIAIPAYSAYTKTANRTDATRTMTYDAQALERCYSQTFSFLGCMSAPAGSSTSAQGYYTVTIAPTANSFTITATPLKSPQTKIQPAEPLR